MKMKKKFIAPLLCAAVGTASLSLAITNAISVNAETNELIMTMTNAASIRYDEPTGIRFETTYSATDFSEYESYSFGTLVIPTDMLEENEELTHETENVQDIKKIGWYDAASTDNEKVMRSVLTGIPNTYYGRILTARSYYKDESGNYSYKVIWVTVV